jgi:ferritin-like metal-binding protein YciE
MSLNNSPPTMPSTPKPILIQHLSELYYLEKTFVSNLTHLSSITVFPALKEDIDQQIVDTKCQIVKLEQVFRLYGEEPKAPESLLIRNLFEEKLIQIHSTRESKIRDFLILYLLHSLGNIELVFLCSIDHLVQGKWKK